MRQAFCFALEYIHKYLLILIITCTLGLSVHFHPHIFFTCTHFFLCNISLCDSDLKVCFGIMVATNFVQIFFIHSHIWYFWCFIHSQKLPIRCRRPSKYSEQHFQVEITTFTANKQAAAANGNKVTLKMYHFSWFGQFFSHVIALKFLCDTEICLEVLVSYLVQTYLIYGGRLFYAMPWFQVT